MKFRGQCGCRIETHPNGALDIMLCPAHLPAPAAAATCPVHPDTPLRCPRCFGVQGGSQVTERKTLATRKNMRKALKARWARANKKKAKAAPEDSTKPETEGGESNA